MPTAVAENVPVAPAAAWALKLPSREMPSTSCTARLATSYTSVMPPGAVQRPEDEYSWAVTIMVFVTVVVTLGAVNVVVVAAVIDPPLTSIGVVLSTPEKAMMPPSLPVFAEKLHV